MSKTLVPSPIVLKTDAYQGRYERHQAKKKRQLMTSEGEVGNSSEKVLEALELRRSQRIFNSNPIPETTLKKILKVSEIVPSSCNRHGMKIKVIKERKDKELLGGILVGGVGWVHRADTILLFLADPIAYKSPNERDFMHYVDAGFLGMGLWMAAEQHGIGVAYINPNITHKDIFNEKYANGHIFCGALALGNYDHDKRALKSEDGSIEEILL